MTFVVPAPGRRLLQTSAVALALALCATASASAAPSDPDPSSPDEAPPSDPDPSSPDEFDGDLGAIDDGPDTTPDTTAPPEDEPILPPRVDGPYLGVVAIGTVNFASVLDLDTPAPLIGGGGFIQAGDAVLPWMSIGIAAGGQAGFNRNQRIFEGALLVEFGFLPAKRYPLSIRTGFGFGGGAIREDGVAGRAGFGGALFKGSLRYEFFPLAAKNRPDRGGGWAIGPELGWLGATPSAKGQPFVNTIMLGLSTSFYWGS